MKRRAIFQVCVGEPSKLYAHCLNSVGEYCDRMGFVHIEQYNPTLKITPDLSRSGRSKEAVDRLGYLPIFEKENFIRHLVMYDEIAVIDADVYIRPSTNENIFDQLSETSMFAAMVEDSGPITKKHRLKLLNYGKMQYDKLREFVHWSPSGIPQFMNMGVMVIKDDILTHTGNDPEAFIKQSDFERFVNGEGHYKWSTDQTLLNYWLGRDSIPHNLMDWRWNALYTAVEPSRLKEAWAIHFYLKDKLPQRGENVEELMRIIGE